MVVGNREDAQRQAIELGAALLVASNGVRPEPEVLELARERGASGGRQPARLLRLEPHDHPGAPCRALADRAADRRPRRPGERDRRGDQGRPLPRGGRGRPRRQAGRPRHPLRPRLPHAPPRAARRPRRAGPERARRRGGRDRRDPRPPPHRLDRDAGPGARDLRPGRLDRDARRRALPPERHGAEQPAAAMLLAAVLSDTVLLNSPTTTGRDRVVVDYLERALGVDARSSAARCSRPPPTSPACPPTRSSPATPRSTSSPAARRSRSPRSRSSARRCSSASDELREALERVRDSRD